MPRYEKDLKTVREIVLEVGKYLDGIFNKIQSGEIKNVGIKGKGTIKNYATDHDIASERIILQYLRDAFPELPVLAEETASGIAFPDGAGFAVDPLDGTRGFRHGTGEYTISVARFEDGKAVFGTVYAPSRNNDAYPARYKGELFEAIRQKGVTLNEKPLVKINSGLDLSQSLVATGWNYFTDVTYLKNDLMKLAPLVSHANDVTRFGSGAYDLCKVAAGRLGSYFERGWGDPWGLSAGLLIVEESDGVTSTYAGKPIDLFHKNVDGKYDVQWAASKNRKIHKELLEFLKEFHTSL